MTQERAAGLTVEFLRLSSFKRKIRYRPPVLATVFALAYLGLLAPGTQSHTNGRDTKVQAICEFTLLAAALGWGMALGLRSQARAATEGFIRSAPIALFGTYRYSWDEAGISLAYPVGNHQHSWLAVDEVLEGNLGVHLLWRGVKLFSIPKDALPAEWSPDKMREVIRLHAARRRPNPPASVDGGIASEVSIDRTPPPPTEQEG